MQEQASPVESPAATEPPSNEKRLAVWEKPIAVVLLSLVFPGLGQVVNREPRKGLVFAASGPILSLLSARAGLYLTFRGLVGSLAVQAAWHLWICVDAFRGARRRRNPSDSRSHSLAVLGSCGALALGVTLFASTNYFLHLATNFKAFKNVSNSFCPTLCEGERVVVDLNAFTTHPPKRGDAISFDFQGKHGPVYIKRIAGIEGDVISESNGEVLVNGSPYTPSGVTRNCGQAPVAVATDRDEPRFDPVRVPLGSFFVIGDNSANSYDSRIQGFGFVTRDQIVGKLAYIYWSPERSRIGCAIE
jgi:signal peptidase I